MTLNQRIVLASRPVGAPTPENFRLERVALPELAEGQVLLKTLYLSLDPYMRGRMSDAPSYAAPVEIGEVMTGGAVSRVERSLNPKFQEGDLVVGATGWQSHSINDGRNIVPVPSGLPSPSMALGVLGMPGMTAYMGLMDIGQPKSGETLVVAAASGAVGSVVGQVAKIKGLRVVGVAGGADKCRYVVEELGFDACIDHKSPDFADELAQACPKGIDIYYENVGGKVFDAVRATAQSQGADSALWADRFVQRQRGAERPGSLAAIAAHAADQARANSGLHRVRRLWRPSAGIRQCHGAVGARRQGQVPRRRGRGSGAGARGVHRSAGRT